MNPIHLKTFLSVAKHRNYSHAGKELFLSQPAVSRQMRQLEQELGVLLFEQIGKVVDLTDAGRTLQREAERLLGSIERVAEIVMEHRSATEGRLRVGASTTPGFYLLPPIIGAFHKRFPGIDLNYIVGNSAQIEERIIRNELDIGLIGGTVHNADIAATKIADDEIVCFTARKHPLALRRKITLKDLEAEICVGREEGSATLEAYDAWRKLHRLSVGRKIQMGCPEAVKTLVASGVGYGFLSIHGLRDELRRGKLTRLRVPELKINRALYMIHHRDKHFSPVIQTFVSLIQDRLPTYATI